ncbi:MAG: LuxR C-terminal-related transcriptional regulator [Dehalococcoidia bacterium]|nr:LuxR C-terminal-related transcriptional regulator [Dehalococcoidia bacterium]
MRQPITPMAVVLRIQALREQYPRWGREKLRMPAGEEGIFLSARNREIAKAIGISPKTVEAHVQSLFLKVKARTRTEAVMNAMRGGLLKTVPT